MGGKSVLISGGNLLDPSNRLEGKGDIFIQDGKIQAIGKLPAGQYAADTHINAEGLVVCPGFIDLHCHLRQPGHEYKETIKTGTAAAARGGFTTICCMPNTLPPLDTAEAIAGIARLAARDSAIRVVPIGCTTRNRKGKELAPLYELAECGVAGFSDDGSPVADAWLLMRAMEYTRPLGIPIIEHCEDLNISRDGQINEGLMSYRLGLPGIPAASEDIAVSRNLILAGYTGAHLHIAHLSTTSSVEMVRQAKKKGINVTCEVTPHHLTLTEEAVAGYDTNAKVNPPLRTQTDIDALIEGIKDGTIDAVATDHAPHSLNDKQQEFGLAPPGISNFETCLAALLGLVNAGKIDINTLIRKLTCGPANVLGNRYGHIGTLSNGSQADVTIFDPASVWQVEPDEFVSLGRNTPLAGKKLKGKVVITLFGGETVYHGPQVENKTNMDKGSRYAG